MNATITRGRRVLAVVATASTLLLPALGASAAPAEQANERATAAQADGDSTQWTEDNDLNDGGTPNNVADDGDNEHPSGKDRSVENGNSGNQGNATSDPDDDGRGPDRSNGGADKPNGPGGEDLADQDGNNGCGNDDDFEDDNEGWCGNNPRRGGPDRSDVDGSNDDDENENGSNENGDNENAAAGNDSDNDNGSTAGSDEETRTGTGAVLEDSLTVGTTNEPTLRMGVAGLVVTREQPAAPTPVETGVLGVTISNDTPDALAAAIQEDDDDDATEDGDAAEAAASTGTLPRTGAGLAGLAALGLSALAGGTALSRRRN